MAGGELRVDGKFVGTREGESAVPTITVGSSVQVGDDTFPVDGRLVHGLAADRPTAAAMHAVLPFAYYNSVDAGTIAQTDGTNWVAQS